MHMTEQRAIREEMCRWGRSLFERGLTSGSSGNMSARLDDGSLLVTPTNSCLGFLDPEQLARIDLEGQHLSGAPPTKEIPLHRAVYVARPETNAVIHLHSTYATALSCLSDIDPRDVVAPVTPYVVMRVGRVGFIPYTRPGSPDVYPLVLAAAKDYSAILLANHGPVVSGPNLEAAIFAAEELEETAKLMIVLRGLPIRLLTDAQVSELEANRSHLPARKGRPATEGKDS
jgi:3-dehydro-4-phosphotetronate decarboxylase